jgi:small subunit ribosomal protein S18
MNYQNVASLQQFISEQGKILPRRMTRLSAKEQRAMTKAIKKARVMGLLYFSLNFRGTQSQKILS